MKTALAFALLTSIAGAAEPFTSGVPVGKRPGPYSFLVATGPERGKLTCFICETDDKPAAVVFARSLSEPLGTLMLKLDAETGTRKDFKTWLTLLTPTADLDALAKWAQKTGLKSAPVGAFEDADGPPAYTLHKDADVTVLIFEKKKVLVNAAFKTGELTAEKADGLLKDLAKAFAK